MYTAYEEKFAVSSITHNGEAKILDEMKRLVAWVTIFHPQLEDSFSAVDDLTKLRVKKFIRNGNTE